MPQGSKHAAMRVFLRDLESACNEVSAIVNAAQSVCTVDTRKTLTQALALLDSVFVTLTNDTVREDT